MMLIGVVVGLSMIADVDAVVYNKRRKDVPVDLGAEDMRFLKTLRYFDLLNEMTPATVTRLQNYEGDAPAKAKTPRYYDSLNEMTPAAVTRLQNYEEDALDLS